MATEKEMNELNAPLQSDYKEVVRDIAEELLARLNIEEDGAIIDMFQTGSLDPWQLFVFFSALEHALMEFRTDKRIFDDPDQKPRPLRMIGTTFSMC